MLRKLGENYTSYFYFVFRVLVGLLFAQHGAQKLFGAIGGSQAPLLSLMGLAGIIEFFGGLAIALGLLTRLAALLGGIEMLVAYSMVHVSQSFFPILNQGEPALLFFASFLVLLAFGAKKWALDNVLFKNY